MRADHRTPDQLTGYYISSAAIIWWQAQPYQVNV